MTVAGLENIFLEVITASRDAGILALAIGALLLFAGRKITPHWKHLLWMLVALRLMLPVLPESPSSWQSLIPEETIAPQKVMPVIDHALPNDLPKVMPYQPAEKVNFQPPTIVTEAEAIPLSWPSILALVWITGVVGFLILLCICTLRFRRKLRRLSFPDHEKIAPLRELLEQLCRETGIRRSPALRITEAVTSPALTGLLRPEILIPPSAIEQLKMSELRLVLLHELGHQQRRDLWTSWLLSLLHVVHWFNPLVWWAFYRTRHESERATDAWVLQKTGADRAADYGEALLRLLEGGIKTKMPLPDIVGILESPRDLRARIIAIGKFTGKRSRWAVAFSVALICGLVAVGFTQAPKDKVEKEPLVEEIAETKKEAEPKKDTSREKIETTLKGRTIDFIVKDPDGNPVADTEVDVFLPYEDLSLPVRFKYITDLNGKVSIPRDPDWGKDGFICINAFSQKDDIGKGGRTYFNRLSESPTGIERNEPLEINLAEGKAIRFRITDSVGKPVSGIRMRASEFLDENNQPCFGTIPLLKDGFWNAITDLNGVCEIEELPNDTMIYVDHDDEKYAHVEGRRHRVKYLSVNDSNEIVEIQLIPSASISGTVKFPNGKAVEKGIITTVQSNSMGPDKILLGKNGAFKLTGLRPANYELHVSLLGEEKDKWWVPITYSAELKEGESRSGIEILLKSAASISGTVKFPDGRPLGEARVGIKASGKRETSVEIQLDKNGAFKLGGLAPGTNKISILLTGKERVDWSSVVTTIKDLKKGESREDLEIVLERGVLVTGKVTFGDTGKPVERVVIISRGDMINLGTTNEEGSYRFRLPSGRNSLSISAFLNGRSPKGYSVPDEREIHIEGKDGDTFTADFVLPRTERKVQEAIEIPPKVPPKAAKDLGKTIDFIVKNSDGNTVPDADIDIFLPYENPTLPIQFKVKTDLEGKASIPINPNWGKRGYQEAFLLNAFSQKDGLGKGARTYINIPVKYVGGFASENPVVINFSKGKMIRIRVTDNTGNPISGIRMRASSFWRMSDGTDPPCMGEIPLLKDGFWNAKTDSDGLCEIEELPEDTLVHLDHDEEKYAHVESRGDITKFLSVNDAKGIAEIQLIPSASISGTVKLPDGTVVEGGLIRTKAASIGGAIESSMGNDGSFKLNRLRPADYALHVVLPDAIKYKWWAPITYSNGVKEGETRSGIKIQLKPAASISGTVKFPDGKPIGGARIRIKASGWREAFDEIQLDANGAFKFRGLTSGTDQIAVSLLGPKKENWASSITKIEALKDGESRTGLEVILNSGVLVTGKVTFGDTGKPVSGISVFSQGDTTEQAETNEEGLYRMRLPTGRNPITISWDRPKGYSAPEDRNIVVEGKAGDTATADFVLPRDIIIRGRVLGPDKTPLEGATVICVKEGNYYITEKVISDETGEFEFELPSITKEATFFATLGTLRTKKKIEVKKGEALVLSLEKNNKAILDGRVVDGEGNPIKGVKVVSSIPKILPHSVEERTNSEGEYTLDTLFLKDKFRLNARKGGYGLNSIDIDLSKGYEKNLPDIVIERADKTVSGKVVDSKGNPVPNAWVDVDGLHQPIEFHKKDYFADNDGSFVMEGIADRWIWIIGGDDSDGNNERFGRIRVRSNSKDVVLVLEKGSRPGPQKRTRNLIGKVAPPLKIKKWLNSEPFSEDHRGKVRLIKFIGVNRSLHGLSNSLSSVEKLWRKYSSEKDVEIMIVHGPWPEEEVKEILHQQFSKLKVPLALEPKEGGMSEVFGVKFQLNVVIDRDGKVAFQNYGKWEKAKAKIAELLKKKGGKE